jgi:flagellar hook-associated protein 2
MASFTSLGVGLGGSVDVNALIKASVDIARLPITRTTGLTYQSTLIDAKISTYGQIKSLVSTLSDAASKLTSVSGWNAVTATSSNKDAITASAVGGTVASTFAVEVQGLAKSQTTTSTSLTKDVPVGAGTLNLTLGTWSDPSTFTPGAGQTGVDITVSATDTLSQIASKINGANAGVSATIVSDTSGERLLLRSKSTGEESGFRMSVTDDDGDDADVAGLSQLMNGQTTSYAANAKATINGIEVTSSSNTFTNTVSGVTFTVAKETTSPVDITVASDTSKVKENMDAFVKAYNAVNQALNTITAYDKDTKTAGLLQGDSSAVTLQNTLRMALQSVASGSGALKTLSDIGISTAKGTNPLQPTGDLEIDSTKLEAALKDPAALKAFFRGPEGGNASDGVGTKIKATLDGLLADGTGYFSSKDALLKKAKTLNEKDIQSVEDRATRLETSLTARYVALDTKMSTLNALNSYIAQQVTTWNKSSS